MKKMENVLEVTGYLYEISKIEERKSKKGVTYITATLNIAVDEDGTNVIPVVFGYVPEERNGQPDRTYKVLKQWLTNKEALPNPIKNPTWVEMGKETAVKINVKTTVEKNEYYSKQQGDEDFSLNSSFRISGSFLNTPKDFEPKAEFVADMLITKLLVKENDEGQSAVISGCVFSRGNAPKIVPVDFDITNPKGIDYLESYGVSSASPMFTKVKGIIKNSTVSTEKATESAWGDTIIVKTSSHVNSWEVTAMANEPYDYDTEGILTTEEVTKMLQEREVEKATMKQAAIEREQNKKNATNVAAATPIAANGAFNFM